MVRLVLGQPSISGGAHGGRQGLAGITTWAVVYGGEVAPARLKPFGLVVVDSNVVQQTAALKWSGAKIPAYLSLGEVHQARSYFAQVRSAGWLVRENPKWKGSFMVGVRHEGWRRMVVERLAPEILGRGFDGLFLDILDYAGSREEALRAYAYARLPRGRLRPVRRDH